MKAVKWMVSNLVFVELRDSDSEFCMEIHDTDDRIYLNFGDEPANLVLALLEAIEASGQPLPDLSKWAAK